MISNYIVHKNVKIIGKCPPTEQNKLNNVFCWEIKSETTLKIKRIQFYNLFYASKRYKKVMP